MSLPDERLLSLLADEFVVGWSSIEKKPFVGLSHGYDKTQTAVDTTNGAGGRNVQLVVMARDLAVLHVLPGFWHPEDLAAELRFALQLHRLYGDRGRSRAERDRMAAVLRESHVRGLSSATVTRCAWQHFDQREELERYRQTRDPRDTIVLTGSGQLTVKPMCLLVHDRMASRVFQKLGRFDFAGFVDYGRALYDNNARFDAGSEFATARKIAEQRAEAEAEAWAELERRPGGRR